MLINSSIKANRTTENIFWIKGMRFEHWPYWWRNGKIEQTNITLGSDGGDGPYVCVFMCVFQSAGCHITPGLDIMSKVWHQNNGYSVAPLISHFSCSWIPLEKDWKWACITGRVWQHLEQQAAWWKMATLLWRFSQNSWVSGSILLLHWILSLQNCQSNLERIEENNAWLGEEKTHRVLEFCLLKKESYE